MSFCLFGNIVNRAVTPPVAMYRIDLAAVYGVHHIVPSSVLSTYSIVRGL